LLSLLLGSGRSPILCAALRYSDLHAASRSLGLRTHRPAADGYRQ
jgi:hypothetical protein